MQALALTRASTIGPIAAMLEASGGSVARVFRASGLPIDIIDTPDRLILLRDQFRLIEKAARDIGDDAFPARLSSAAGLDGLGPWGRHILSFDCLGAAITTGYRAYASLLQASTRLELVVQGPWARWSYSITAPIAEGRQKNELLALGYMLQIIRRFAGPRWTPECIQLPGLLPGRRQIEAIFAGHVTEGDCAAVIFPADLLEAPNLNRRPWEAEPAELVPSDDEFIAVVTHMITLDSLGGRAGIDQLARRIGLKRRTLQRRLAENDTTFEHLSGNLMRARACALLRDGERPISDVALELGYSDAAHFTRAFRRWTGEAPLRWRMRESTS